MTKSERRAVTGSATPTRNANFGFKVRTGSTGNGNEKEKDRTIPERREATERKHNPALLSKNNVAPIKTLLRISGFLPSVAESEADREFGRCRISAKIGGCAW